jgi:plasmid stabilization system protein ParE
VEKGVLIMSDEIYEKLVYDGAQHTSVAGFSPQHYEHTIIVHGLAKAYSMTGWRIGLTAAPEPIAKAIDAIQSHSTSNPTSFAQKGAVAALNGPQDHLPVWLAEFARRRTLCLEAIEQHSRHSCVNAKGAFYLFPNISKRGLVRWIFAPNCSKAESRRRARHRLWGRTTTSASATPRAWKHREGSGPNRELRPRPRMKSWRNHWPALWLLLILAFVAVVRIRLLSRAAGAGRGEYAYAGQLMLEGEPPYQLIYNMKMPGIYAAYALIMAVFGQSAPGIRLGFMLVNFGAIVLMYFVGRRFLDRAGAVAASAAYALLSLSPHVQGSTRTPRTSWCWRRWAATLVLLRAQERGRLAGFFWSGALFGLAFLMKQPGGAFAFFGFSMLLWAALRREPPDWKKDGMRLAVMRRGWRRR